MNATAQRTAHQITEAGLKTGERLADVGEVIAAEAAELADRIGAWLADTDPVGQARGVATESLHTIRDWSSDLPERIAAALPVVATVPAKPKKRTLVGMFALGAAVAYFFDPASGAARRDAVKQRISGLVKRGAPGDNVPGE
jgi:hypothetical protein